MTELYAEQWLVLGQHTKLGGQKEGSVDESLVLIRKRKFRKEIMLSRSVGNTRQQLRLGRVNWLVNVNLTLSMVLKRSAKGAGWLTNLIILISIQLLVEFVINLKKTGASDK